MYFPSCFEAAWKTRLIKMFHVKVKPKICKPEEINYGLHVIRSVNEQFHADVTVVNKRSLKKPQAGVLCKTRGK